MSLYCFWIHQNSPAESLCLIVLSTKIYFNIILVSHRVVTSCEREKTFNNLLITSQSFNGTMSHLWYSYMAHQRNNCFLTSSLFLSLATRLLKAIAFFDYEFTPLVETGGLEVWEEDILFQLQYSLTNFFPCSRGYYSGEIYRNIS